MQKVLVDLTFIGLLSRVENDSNIIKGENKIMKEVLQVFSYFFVHGAKEVIDLVLVLHIIVINILKKRPVGFHIDDILKVDRHSSTKSSLKLIGTVSIDNFALEDSQIFDVLDDCYFVVDHFFSGCKKTKSIVLRNI